MRKILKKVLWSLTLISVAPVFIGAQRLSEANAQRGAIAVSEIKSLLRDNIESDKLGVGLAVGIMDEQGPKIVSHGNLDNGADAEVDGNTIFEIGSITKVFTALLLEDMVERGEMKLDDPVQKYLPDSVRMPAFGEKQITLLHLATHTAGLPANPNNVSKKNWRDPDQADYTIEQLYAFLSSYSLRRAPGIQEEYSNVGMELLGHVIARKAGKDYETLMTERICQPLGMDSTRITISPELKSRLAIGHAIPARRVAGMDFQSLPGAGGLHSTANDLVKFLSAYIGLTSSPQSLLIEKAKAFHTMESGKKLMLAWGGDNTVFAHNGGTYGFTAVLGFDPKARRGVVVLSNCRNNRIVDDIWQPLLEARSPKPAFVLPMDASIYDSYAGQYELDERSNICTVRREGDRLLIRWIGRAGERYISEEVFPQTESIFRNEFWGLQARFFADEHALRLILTSVGPYSGFKEPINLIRISRDVPEVPEVVRLDFNAYNAFVGRFRKAFLFGLIHLGPTLSISHRADELGNHLIASVRGVPGYDVAEFFPMNRTNFMVNPVTTDDNIRLTFVPNRKGEMTRVNVSWNGRKLRGSRISTEPFR